MKNLNFFRRETFEEARNRRYSGTKRPSIPALIDNDIDHMFLEIRNGESIAVEIGDYLVTVKAELDGSPRVQILTKPVWAR